MLQTGNNARIEIGETMATRKPVTVGEFLPADDPERLNQLAAGKAMAAMPDYEPEIQEPDPDDIALQNVLAELGTSGADAKVNIYQLDARQNRAFIGAFLPSEFSLERVQTDFGPGDYEIRVYNSGRLATRKVIKIAAPKNATALPAFQNNPGIETQKIIETMQLGFEKMGGMFAQALSTLANNQPKPKTTLETLQELQAMREVFAQPQNTQPDPMKLFEMATQISEKITPRVGEPGTGEIILEAIKNFGPMIATAAENRQSIQSAIPLQAAAPLQNPASQLPKPQEQNISSDDTDMNLARKMYLNLLIKNAQADNDPATYAQLMLDLAGTQAAMEFANNPDWFNLLCSEEPRAAQYKDWFSELRDAVIDLTTEEKSDITTTEPVTKAPDVST